MRGGTCEIPKALEWRNVRCGDMGINICCDVMFRDRKVGRLEIVNSKLIKNEVYTDNLMEHPFPRSKDMMTILEILKGRVICRERFTEEIQRATGLKEYNVYGLLRDNHGLNINEYSWLKFERHRVG